MSPIRHCLSLLDFTTPELIALLERACELKRMRQQGEPHVLLPQKTLGMLFEKASTRTRVSFEAGMAQLGGSALFLSPRDTQLGRGEPVADTARVLSRMVDAIMIRAHEHRTLEIFAEHSAVPVINALTDRFHPCQLLADMQTWFEHRGPIEGRTVAWIGDGNNVCHSYINAAARLGFSLRVACPPGYAPDDAVITAAGAEVAVMQAPEDAVAGADLVVTDVWTSMGQEDENARRLQDFDGYQVNSALMARAAPEALFMHCLPAHRGEEVSAEVIDGPQSVVWDEAENRLHAQKALLEFLIPR
jgi:ornithine carbamoyltransferase